MQWAAYTKTVFLCLKQFNTYVVIQETAKHNSVHCIAEINLCNMLQLCVTCLNLPLFPI